MAVISPWRAAGSSFEALDGVFSPLEFGGDPNGVEDSTEAIQAAIDAAEAVNGTVHFGGGRNLWKYSSTLYGKPHIRLTSASGGNGGQGGSGPTRNAAGAELRFTGGANERAFLWEDVYRFTIDHLRFTYDNPAFTGTILHLENSEGGAPAIDPTNWRIESCEFQEVGTTPPAYARAFIMLHKAITGQILGCHFNRAKNLISMGDQTEGSSYCNGVHIQWCSFNDANPVAHAGQILIAANDLNMCTIKDNIFSGGSGHVPIRGTNEPAGHAHDEFNDLTTNRCTGLVISGNYMSDGTGVHALVDGLNSFTNVRPIVISGNFFGSGGGYCVRAGAGEAASFGVGPPLFVLSGNAGHNPVYTFGTLEPPGDIQYCVSVTGAKPSFGPGEEAARVEVFGPNGNAFSGHVHLASHSDFNDLDYTTIDSLNFGPNVAGADPFIGSSPGCWQYLKTHSGGALVGQRLTLQGPTDGGGTGDGVQIVAGNPVPTIKLRANAAGIAFNDAEPVGKATLGSAVSASAPAAVSASPGSALSAFSDPPLAGEMAALRTAVNANITLLTELKTKLDSNSTLGGQLKTLANNNRTALVNNGLGQT